MHEIAQRTEREQVRALRTIGILIDSGAFRLEPTVLNSGLLSPMKIEADILCANPVFYKEVCGLLAEMIREYGAKPEVVVGVITGGAFLAREVALMAEASFAACLGNTTTPEKLAMASGEVLVGNRVVIIEDVVTTGGNVFSLHERLVGADTQLVLSVFDYGFEVAQSGFAQRAIVNQSLSTFEDLIKVLEWRGIDLYDLKKLRDWHESAPSKLRGHLV